jgi:hypothetical protein
VGVRAVYLAVRDRQRGQVGDTLSDAVPDARL